MNKRIVGTIMSLSMAILLTELTCTRSPGEEKNVVPASVAVKIVAEDSKDIQKILNAENVRSSDRRRALVSALVVATVANNNAKDPQMAAVRDQAVQLLNALKADDADSAKKAAKRLTNVKPASPGSPQDLGLEKYLKEGDDFDRDTTMQ